jgi:chorismate synthase
MSKRTNKCARSEKKVRFITSGESHGVCLVGIIEGFPRGLEIGAADIDRCLEARQKGYGRGARMKIEKDRVEILSGVRNGKTTGGAIALRIANRDHEAWLDTMKISSGANLEKKKITVPRPGHADLPGMVHFDVKDARDILEFSSARKTAMIVALGAISKKVLSKLDIDVLGFVVAIGGIETEGFDFPDTIDWQPLQTMLRKTSALKKTSAGKSTVDKSRVDILAADRLYASSLRARVEKSLLRTFDAAAEKKMIAAIDKAKKEGDSLGGIIQVNAVGLPPGLGRPAEVGGKLSERLAAAAFSIGAIKGVELGYGFALTSMRGSVAVDPIVRGPKGLFRLSNKMGGLEGGMTNGEKVILRAAMKPIPTTEKGVPSVDVETGESAISHKERADTCAVPAASVILEAAVANALAAMVLEEFGSTTMTRLEKAIASWRKEWRNWLK